MPHNQAPDWAIPGDEQEESRRRLEQDVLARVGDLTFENTDTHSTEYSVEYPRHREPGDGAFSSGADAFPSFSTHEHHDLSHFDGDISRLAPDFRSLHGGDDSVMHVAETFSSSLNHHASAVTLGAGLGGLPGRTPSRSNIAEFDPERKLPDLLDGRGRSLLDDSVPLESHQNSKPPRQKPFIPSFSTADPIIVEDTAELDRALESGQFEVHNAPSAEPHRDNFGFGESDPEDDSASTMQQSETGSSVGGRGGRATLTDTLGNGRAGAFSPKRPRRAQGFQRSERIPPPNPASTRTIGGASRFTVAARGLTNEIERERQDADRADAKFFAGPKDVVKPSFEGEKRAAKVATNPRDPPTDVRSRRSGPSRPFHFPRNTSVHLPDVTGLTSAVATPNKASRRYRHIKQSSADATVIKATIEQLAARLREFETENITSRRRVRELELDLEKCRADVARERTRAQAEIQKQLSQNIAKERDRKGKGRADEPTASSSSKPTNPEELRVWEARYKEVVDTKKALENLVTSLRTQLAQMTAELDEHRRIVEELRSLREQDEAEIFRRCQEVEDLREEVERLGEEVHRLRGIIEESVRERRDAAQREEGSFPSGQEDEQSSHPPSIHLLQVRSKPPNALSPVPEESSQDPQLSDPRQSDDDRARTSRPSSRLGSTNRLPIDHSIASNDGFEFRSRATVGSSGRTARRFISLSELERVESDVEDRRSFLSSRSLAGDDEASQTDMRPKSPANPAGPSLHEPRQQPHRRSRLDPDGPSNVKPGKEGDAFPQIRGARMEKLFFSLPEHNESTCRVCRCRGPNLVVTDPERREGAAGGKHLPSLPRDNRKSGAGFEEADPEELLDAAAAAFDRARLKRDRDERDDGELPPQTILARVLRELEDDFTHFKSIYVELAEQYGKMDPASNILKRHVLADHLREVIEALEEKGDQIASLYDLLSFKDKPDAAVPLLSRRTRHTNNTRRRDGISGVPIDVNA